MGAGIISTCDQQTPPTPAIFLRLCHHHFLPPLSQACIDLERGVLRLKTGLAAGGGGAGSGAASSSSAASSAAAAATTNGAAAPTTAGYVEVPFLSEREVPKSAFGHGGINGDDSDGEGGGSGSGDVKLKDGGSGSGGASAGGGVKGGGGASSSTAAPGGGKAAGGGGSGGMHAPIDLSGLVDSPAKAPAAKVPAPSGGGAAAASTVDEAALALLQGMGFPRATCVRALELAGGNVEAAAALLPDL
jgi:hypothetical protein